MDRFGSLKYWINDAMDEKIWTWLIESKQKKPHLKHKEPASTSLPPNNNPSPPSTPLPRRPYQNGNRLQQEPPRNPPQSPPQRTGTESRNYNPDGIGRNLRNSLAILGFTLEDNMTERHISCRYIEMGSFSHIKFWTVGVLRLSCCLPM